MNATLTVEQAKASTMKNMATIISQVPPDIIASTEMKPDGPVVQGCEGPDASTWLGAAFVHLREGTHDFDQLLHTIGPSWTAPYSTRYRLSNGKYPSLVIEGPNHESYYVGKDADHNALSIAAYSECFTLEEGLSRFARY
jgi:hypothetical protein